MTKTNTFSTYIFYNQSRMGDANLDKHFSVWFQILDSCRVSKWGDVII